MRRSVFFMMAGVLAVLSILPLSRQALADQAPFWESPMGLAPGNPDIQVRMAAETVDISVVERGNEIHAAVQASFSMVNDGPDATVKVGFPATTTSLFDALAEPDENGVKRADAPAMFSPQAIRAFRVAADGQELRSWRQDVQSAADAGFGADWLMWEMVFPAGQTTVVNVQYEQVLTDRASDLVVQPMYVLRTGALWSGVIGEATITLRADGGGALIGGPELFSRMDDAGKVVSYPRAEQVYGSDDAAEATASRIVWRFADLEPTRDVGATYVRSSAWQPFVEAERALQTDRRESPTALRHAARNALDILGGPAACSWDDQKICVAGRYGVPRSLVVRLAGDARERARRAVELAADDPEAQQVYGDVEFWYAMPARKNLGELGCWPSEAVDAYERAQTLGAGGSVARLDALRAAARQVRFFGSTRIDICSGIPDGRLQVELVKATIEHGNAAWSAGVGRQGTADRYSAYFGGRWLDDLTTEVAALRSARQVREARLDALEFTSV
ncbi:MAG: hypothetical protein AB7K36_22340, partial [Chloroflexota bacterium]